MIKKTISVLLVLTMTLLILCIGFTSFANETSTTINDEPILRYKVISSHSSGVHISGVTAYCVADLCAMYSTNLSITMELQKLSSGSYSTIKTWTDSRTGTSLGLEGTRLINVLSTYRLKTTFTAGNETVVVYSNPT